MAFASVHDLSSSCLTRFLETAITDSSLRTTVRRRDFRGAHGVDGALFDGSARFVAATFEGDLRSRGAVFPRDAVFDRAHFHGYAWFGASDEWSGATFEGGAASTRLYSSAAPISPRHAGPRGQ